MSIKDELLKNSHYPSKDPNNMKSYLGSFAEQASYDSAMGDYSASVNADIEDLRFTGNLKNRDYLLDDASELGKDDLEEYKAQVQDVWTKRARGVARLGFKTAMNIMEMPGIAFGAVQAAATGDPYALIDNGWSNAIQSANEWFDEEAMPIYMKKAVKEGNLWDNIKSVDFWATEGADGLAFALAALVPGAAVKGLKLGSKVANGLAKSKGGKYLSRMDDALAKKLGTAGVADTTDIAASTAFNTIYEAGIEAQMGMDSYDNNIYGLYKNGEITTEQYAELSKKTGQVGSNIFTANAALLLGPNALMAKSLFGKALPKKQLGKFKRIDGKYVPEASTLTKKQRFLQSAKDTGSLIGKSTASEGLVEEAGQMVAEKYNTEGTIEEYLHGDRESNIIDLYGDVLGSTEGQKAIMLGGLFGTGMTKAGDLKNRKASKSRNNELADMMSRGANLMDVSINGVYQTNENGDIKFENGKPVVDEAKLVNFGNEMEFVQSIHDAKDKLDEAGLNGEMSQVEIDANKDMLDETLKKQALLSFVHAQDEGLEVLKNYLDNGSGVESIFQGELENNPEFNVKGAKEKLKSDLMAEATSLQEDLKYAQQYMHFDNQLNVNQSDEHYGSYMSKLHQDFVIANSNSRLISEKINELESNKSRYMVTDEASLDTKGLFMDNMEREINSYKKAKENLEKRIKKFSDPVAQEKEFNAYKKQQDKLNNIKEEAADLDSKLDDINNAKNRTDTDAAYDKADSSNPIHKKAMDEARARKERVFEAKKAAAVERVTKEATNSTKLNTAQLENHNDALEYVAGEFNEGEVIQLPEGLIAEVMPGAAVQVTEIHEDGSVTLTDVETNVPERITRKYVPNNTGEVIPTETEGVNVNTDTVNTFTTEISDDTLETDPKIANNGYGTSEGYLEYFQLNGQDKVGMPITFGLFTPGAILKDTPALVVEMISKSKDALKVYRKVLAGEATTEMEDLIFKSYFPLSVNIDGTNHGSFIHAEFNGDKSKPEFKIRQQILKVLVREVSKGKKVTIENIGTTIKNQGKGILKIDKGSKNNLNDLKYIQEIGIENIEFNVLNDAGVLMNPITKEVVEGSTVYNPSWSGAVFAMIQRESTGESFPLHVNIERMSETHAAGIFDILDIIVSNPGINDNAKLTQIDAELSTPFTKELELLSKLNDVSKEDLTINDLLRFMYFTGSKSVKSTLGIKDGQIVFGDNVINKADLNDDTKEEFVDWVSKNKNRNIQTKYLSNDDYKRYITDNKILYSNAATNEALFAENSDIFLDVNVKLKNKIKPVVKEVKPEVSITKVQTKMTPAVKRYYNSLSTDYKQAMDAVNGLDASVEEHNEQLHSLSKLHDSLGNSSTETAQKKAVNILVEELSGITLGSQKNSVSLQSKDKEMSKTKVNTKRMNKKAKFNRGASMLKVPGVSSTIDVNETTEVPNNTPEKECMGEIGKPIKGDVKKTKTRRFKK